MAVAVALVLIVATAVPLAVAHGEFVAARHPDFTRTKRFSKFLAPRTDDTPLVLTLGDSTLRSPIPFPTQVGAWIKQPIETRTLWVAGLSQSEAALIVAGALELEPEALVLVAHFAMFEANGPLTRREFQRVVPLHRLPDLLGLPFDVQGVGFAEIALSSVVGAVLPEPWIAAKRGGPRWFDSQLRRRWRVATGTPAHRQARLARMRTNAIGRSARSFHAGHPSLEMIRGSVRMAERSGVEALVVVSPINRDAVDETVGYDEARALASVAALREEVEAEGGDLIDAHAALTRDQFYDDLGHYLASGAREIAIPVEAWTREVLGYPPSRRHEPRARGGEAGS